MDSLERYLDQQPGRANPMTLKDGDVVDDWRIRALIGRGGSSEVYRVEHVRNGSFAALKLLLPVEDTAAEERHRQRFWRETELLSTGGFPGFPRYCGTGTWQGRPCLVEELLESRDLPWTDRACAKYLLAICRGVAELHKRGIVHRDLRARRNLNQTQSALNVDFGTLEENTLLNGATKVFRHPILLASNRIYRVTGPGTLDADISGSTNSLLILKNCVLVNRTTQTYPKNGVRYRLDNGVYLNFINQKERPRQFRQFILPYDGAYNEARFGVSSPRLRLSLC